jgi:glycine hydroxymethyltransferase
MIAEEAARQARTLTLIPSENHASRAVLEASGSALTNKYSEGYPGRRYYEGQACVDPLETLARDRACALFGADHANVQPYSGSPANLAVYAAFLAPGDTVLGMALDAGGHLTHGHGVSVTGKWFRAVRYGVREDTGRIDLDEVREIARRERPKLIWCGGTAIPRIVDFAGFAAIAREVDAILAADIAHVAGLVAGGVHPSPIPHADVVTTTTHKTLRGPRGALILSTGGARPSRSGVQPQRDPRRSAPAARSLGHPARDAGDQHPRAPPGAHGADRGVDRPGCRRGAAGR